MPKLKKNIKTFAALSRISGLSSSKIMHIANGVLENNKLLNSCSFHIFDPIDDPHLSRKFICKNCGGVVDAIRKSWYEKGIEHSQPREERNDG